MAESGLHPPHRRGLRPHRGELSSLSTLAMEWSWVIVEKFKRKRKIILAYDYNSGKKEERKSKVTKDLKV